MLRQSKYEAMSGVMIHESSIMGDSDKWEAVISMLISTWEDMKPRLASNIEYISRPFWDAVVKNKKMFDNTDGGLFLLDYKPKGILLLPDGTQIAYDFSSKKGLWYSFVLRDGCTLYSYAIGEGDNNAQYMATPFPVKFEDGWKDLNSHMAHRFWLDTLISILLFKHYAKVETREMKPDEKIKDLITKEKHLNRSNSSVTILDCTWFTNIIRNTPFGVRGHFRLQPKKNEEGEWIKELIYIEPFMKNGYTIRAKKTK